MTTISALVTGASGLKLPSGYPVMISASAKASI